MREVERFGGLVEGRCDRFRVRVRARDVVVGEVAESGCNPFLLSAPLSTM